MVIPRAHIDHFTDIPDNIAGHIMITAQRLGRNLHREFKPMRIGYVVHGFGVPHAHLNVVPMHESNDIISAKHVILGDSGFEVSLENIAAPERSELNAIARRIA